MPIGLLLESKALGRIHLRHLKKIHVTHYHQKQQNLKQRLNAIISLFDKTLCYKMNLITIYVVNLEEVLIFSIPSSSKYEQQK